MKRRVAGFTMIEILVVIFIVAIMAGVTVASLPQFARTGDIDTEARRLKLLLQMAREEALLQSTEFGFAPEASGYQFLVFDEVERTWTPLESRPFQPRSLDDGMTLSLKVEDTEITLGDETDGPEKRVPPVLLLSSGETSTFDLTISTDDDSLVRTLHADGISDFTWEGQ